MLASGMARITKEDAARIAALAKLEMSGDELDRAARDLASILEYFEALDAVETEGIASPASVAAAPLRDDEPRPSLDPGDAFANAPDADRAAGVFRVPRVLGS